MAENAINFIEIFSSDDDRSPQKPTSIVKTEKKEKIEDLDCIILDFDPFESIDVSKKLSIEDEPSSADDVSIIYDRGSVRKR